MQSLVACADEVHEGREIKTSALEQEASAAGEGHGMASEKTEQGESSLPEDKTSEELSFSNEVQSITWVVRSMLGFKCD